MRLPVITCEQIERAFWIFLAVLAFAIYSLILLHLGGWMQIEQARAEAAKVITVYKARPTANPILLLDCSPRGREEFSRTCRARARTAEVK